MSTLVEFFNRAVLDEETAARTSTYAIEGTNMFLTLQDGESVVFDSRDGSRFEVVDQTPHERKPRAFVFRENNGEREFLFGVKINSKDPEDRKDGKVLRVKGKPVARVKSLGVNKRYRGQISK